MLLRSLFPEDDGFALTPGWCLLTEYGNESVRRGVQDFCEFWKNRCGLSHASRQRSVGMLGKETAKQNLSSAKLLDGTRPRVLALKTTCSLTCSPARSERNPELTALPSFIIVCA